MTADVQSMLNVALDALSHGFAVVPPREDGSKRPDGEWKQYQSRLPTEDEVRGWYERQRCGLGVVCGAVSGNLEMLEFEGRAMDADIHDEYATLAGQAGLGELVDRIFFGYCEFTPTGGLHLLYRVDGGVAGNTKLARRPATADELAADPNDRIKVLIETRGEGGYVIVAPSHGPVHPTSGEWLLTHGGFGSVATITPQERDELHRLARILDQQPEPLTVTNTPSQNGNSSGDRPGDVYNQQPDIAAETARLLERHGWTPVFSRSHGDHHDVHLRRPGKTIGTSAVLHMDAGTLVVFSTSTPFTAEEAYTPFAVYTVLEHAGDYQQAARTLKPASGPADLSDLTISKTAGDATAATRTGSEPTVEARRFETVDVAAHVAAGVTEPSYVPGPLDWLYAGRLTAIQSEPGVGKTWLALWLAHHAITVGADVVYLDEEGGPELIAERLVAFGANPKEINEHLIYVPFPARAWDLADQAGFHQLLDDHPAAVLAVFDSLPDFLAMAGKSEDSAQDVTWWINRVCGICRQHNVAQVVLDHLPKPDADAKKRSRSRYSRGSGAKLAKVDATFLLETSREFDAHHSGQLKLWKTKDRRGRLALPSLGSNPILLDVHVNHGQLDITVRDPEPNKQTEERHFRPTALMERLSDRLEHLNTAGIKPSKNALIEEVKGTRAHKLEALRCLTDEGYITFEAGARNSVLQVLVKPYRQIVDPKSDSYLTIESEAS